jgi:hypothetical protein
MIAARILHIRPLGITDRFLYAETTAGRVIVPAILGFLAAAGAVDVVPEGTRLPRKPRDACDALPGAPSPQA